MENGIRDINWYTEARFGLFIHFGLYSMAARHEWVKTWEKIPEDKYDLYFKHFNPDLFDAGEWARSAKRAGIKYAILTAKHHEGFCLWDTQQTDYKSTNTPFGRDIVREYVDAFRAEGIKIGIYYSLIDWHHEHFTIDVFHPLNRLPDAAEMNKLRDMNIYREYMRMQVSELLTGYGRIDLLYFDNSYPGKAPVTWAEEIHPLAYSPHFDGKGKDDWGAEALIETARMIQPHILINDRTELQQDIFTGAEQLKLRGWPVDPATGERYVWETWQTFGGSWGYSRDERDWQTPHMILDAMVGAVSCGGNFLLNVGPNPRGEFGRRAENILEEIGIWMRRCGRSVYGCSMAGFTSPAGFRYTQNGNSLYLHFLNWIAPDIGWPFYEIVLEGMASKVEYAQFLHDGSEIKLRELDGNLHLNIPVAQPDSVLPVIEMFLKG